jgi:hypothetical protein
VSLTTKKDDSPFVTAIFVSALLKDGHKLKKMIEPNAAMHQAKDKVAMGHAASKVKNFIHQFPTLAPEVYADFDFAYELVMIKTQPPVSKPEKPTLNTEDL